MALDYREIVFGFGADTGNEQVLISHVDFAQPVIRAAAVLQAFFSSFDNGDHHFFAHEVRASIVRIEGARVFVKATYLLRDSSGNIDDPYWGTVNVVVIGDVATRVLPPRFVATKTWSRVASRQTGVQSKRRSPRAKRPKRSR